MSSQDNPQFEAQPQTPMSTEPMTVSNRPEFLVEQLPAGPGVTPVVSAPRDPVWSGWDVLLLAMLSILTLVVAQAITVGVAWIFIYKHVSFSDVLQKPVLALAGEFLSYIAVAAYMIMLVEGKYHTPFWRAIRWNWPTTSMKVLGLGCLGALTILLDALGSRYLPMPKSTPFDEFFAHPRDAYLMAIFAVTFGPLMEELFFRGFLYPVLARRTGAASAVVLTALPFGVMHYLQYKSWAAVLVITLVGVVLTVVRAVTKSVGASFIVHAGYNATLMLIAAAATDGFRHMEKATI